MPWWSGLRVPAGRPEDDFRPQCEAVCRVSSGCEIRPPGPLYYHLGVADGVSDSRPLFRSGGSLSPGRRVSAGDVLTTVVDRGYGREAAPWPAHERLDSQFKIYFRVRIRCRRAAVFRNISCLDSLFDTQHISSLSVVWDARVVDRMGWDRARLGGKRRSGERDRERSLARGDRGEGRERNPLRGRFHYSGGALFQHGWAVQLEELKCDPGQGPARAHHPGQMVQIGNTITAAAAQRLIFHPARNRLRTSFEVSQQPSNSSLCRVHTPLSPSTASLGTCVLFFPV